MTLGTSWNTINQGRRPLHAPAANCAIVRIAAEKAMTAITRRTTIPALMWVDGGRGPSETLNGTSLFLESRLHCALQAIALAATNPAVIGTTSRGRDVP